MRVFSLKSESHISRYWGRINCSPSCSTGFNLSRVSDMCLLVRTSASRVVVFFLVYIWDILEFCWWQYSLAKVTVGGNELCKQIVPGFKHLHGAWRKLSNTCGWKSWKEGAPCGCPQERLSSWPGNCSGGKAHHLPAFLISYVLSGTYQSGWRVALRSAFGETSSKCHELKIGHFP